MSQSSIFTNIKSNNKNKVKTSKKDKSFYIEKVVLSEYFNIKIEFDEKNNLLINKNSYLNIFKYIEKFTQLTTNTSYIIKNGETVEPGDNFKQFDKEYEKNWIDNYNLDKIKVIRSNNNISNIGDYEALEAFIKALKEFQSKHVKITEFHIKAKRENNLFIVLIKSIYSLYECIFKINNSYNFLSNIIAFCGSVGVKVL